MQSESDVEAEQVDGSYWRLGIVLVTFTVEVTLIIPSLHGVRLPLSSKHLLYCQTQLPTYMVKAIVTHDRV